MRKRDYIILGAVFAVLAVLFILRVTDNPQLWYLHIGNIYIFHLINVGFKNGFFDILMPLVTYLGDAMVMVIALIILFFLSLRQAKLRQWVLSMAAILILVGLCSFSLKSLFHVPRPFMSQKGVYYVSNVEEWQFLERPLRYDEPLPRHDKSFPSGHSLVALAIAGMLSFVKKVKWWALAVGCLVAFSRVYIGMHFPADIVVGGILGFLIGYYVTYYLGKTNLTRFKFKI